MQSQFLAVDFRSAASLELTALLSPSEGLGIDGAFVDCPESASVWWQARCSMHMSDSACNVGHRKQVSGLSGAAVGKFQMGPSVLASLISGATVLGLWVITFKLQHMRNCISY